MPAHHNKPQQRVCSRNRLQRRPAVARFVLLLAAASVTAATAQDRRDALEALERERLQALRDTQARSTPQWQPSAGVLAWLPPVDGETPCFAVQRITWASDTPLLTPNRGDSFDWLLQDLGTFVGACLGPQSLDALRRNLDARLVSRGNVTSSVSFAPQNLASGVLQVSLQLGRIARIDLRGAANAISGNALATQPGDVLNLRAIEQTLDNLARLPSQAAQFQIEAADQADHSVVAITAEPLRAWRLSAGLDNAAPHDYGQLQATLQATWDAPLGLSDQVAVVLNRTLHTAQGARYQDAATLSYSMPFGWHLLSVSASRSRHVRPIQGLTTRFSENGFDASVQLRWQWTAWRSASARWNMWVGATARRSRNAVDDVELVLQRRHTRDADWGINGWLRFAAGDLTVDMDAAVAQRVGADADVQLAQPLLPHTRRVQLTWQQAVAHNLHYETRLAWAAVHDPASAVDLQTVGSRWSVRGFDAQDFLTGQAQVTWRQDLRLSGLTAAWLPAVQLQPYLGLDHGRITAAMAAGASGPPARQPGHVLAGAAAGLRWAGHGLSGDLALAAPLHKPSGFAAASTVLYASVAFNY